MVDGLITGYLEAGEFVMLGTHEAARHMATAGGGSISNVSSIGASKPGAP